VLRSSDSGKSWQKIHIPEAESLDFRGVQAIDANIVFVMSSGDGPQSRIYKTTDGGQTWKLQYQGGRKPFFLDALICNNEKHCVALSDPVDGRFLLLANQDGEHWTQLPGEHMPNALPQEGAFAASNSALYLDRKEIYFGTGGPSARLFSSHDFGQTWAVVETPILSGNSSSGIFSLYMGGQILVAIGGDYRDPGRAYKNAAISRDGGKTWQLATRPPGGYRSSIGAVGGFYITVGPTGSETSPDGLNWDPIGSENFNALSVTPSSRGGGGWAVGPHGRIARFLSHLPTVR